METFGEKVRQAVESLGLSLEEVARSTGLRVEDIQALERDDFGALPDDAVVREGLRSFARLVQVDADEVIADYERERQEWLSALPAEVVIAEARRAREAPEGTEPPPPSGQTLVAAASTPRRGLPRGVTVLVSAILAIAVLALLFQMRSPTSSDPVQETIALQSAPAKEAPETRRDPPGAAATAAVSPEEPSEVPDSGKPAPVIEEAAGGSELLTRKHGIGRDVVGHELVGETADFKEGERVWFLTLIEGGIPGDSIEHVWLHDGKVVARVTLNVGTAHWRTKSYKELYPGSVGSWAVEARDESGRVLARHEFLCTPRR